MVIRMISVFFVILITHGLMGQSVDKNGMLRATATFAVGKPFSLPTLHSYVKGELEYQLDDHFSIRGDVYYLVGNTGGIAHKFYKDYHTAFAGVSYHFSTPNNFDPYLGIQAGALYGKSAENILFLPVHNQRTSIDPLVSLHAGFNFYASHYFHLFMQVRYLYGVRTIPSYSTDLSELRFSFGLGFNLNVKRKK